MRVLSVKFKLFVLLASLVILFGQPFQASVWDLKSKLKNLKLNIKMPKAPKVPKFNIKRPQMPKFNIKMPEFSSSKTVVVEDLINKYFKESCKQAGVNEYCENSLAGIEAFTSAFLYVIIMRKLVVWIMRASNLYRGLKSTSLPGIEIIDVSLGIGAGAIFICFAPYFKSLIYKKLSQVSKEKFSRIFNRAVKNCMIELFGLSQAGFKIKAKSPLLEALVQYALCSDMPEELKKDAFGQRSSTLFSNTEFAAAVAQIVRVNKTAWVNFT